MSKKTRRHIWPVSLVMSIAIVGALAAFIVLAVGSGITEAHAPADETHAQACAAMSAASQGLHDAFADADAAKCADDMDSDNGNGMDSDNGNGMMGDAMHATMPTYFWLEGLDNGARLNWEAPAEVNEHAMVVGYQIDRDAWNAMASHPINMYGGATIMVYVHETSHSDLGLAYETVYTYMVRSVVHYNVEGWWDMLDCVEMNAAVSPTGDEPAKSARIHGWHHLLQDVRRPIGCGDGGGAAGLRWPGPHGIHLLRRVVHTSARLETADSGGRLAGSA